MLARAVDRRAEFVVVVGATTEDRDEALAASPARS